MSKPLVSVCIPTFNGATFLKEALDSIELQTYRNIEVIVSDDASSDDTLKIIETFKKEVNLSVNTFNHEPNGIGSNWNHTVKKSNGKYIKFLFQDDVLTPNCIEQMVQLFEENKNVGLVYCKREIIYDPNIHYDLNWVKKFKELHIFWKDIDIQQGILSGKKYLKDKNFLSYPLNKIGEPTAVLLHKDVFKKVGLFSEKLNQELDLEFWYRLMPFFKVGFIDEKLVKFRLHSDQATQLNIKYNSKDSTLLPLLIWKHIFRYLHSTQKKKLLFIILKNTSFYRLYLRLRKKIKI